MPGYLCTPLYLYFYSIYNIYIYKNIPCGYRPDRISTASHINIDPRKRASKSKFICRENWRKERCVVYSLGVAQRFILYEFILLCALLSLVPERCSNVFFLPPPRCCSLGSPFILFSPWWAVVLVFCFVVSFLFPLSTVFFLSSPRRSRLGTLVLLLTAIPNTHEWTAGSSSVAGESRALGLGYPNLSV